MTVRRIAAARSAENPGFVSGGSTRWLAVAVGLLVLVGGVSAVLLVADDDRPGPAVVSAAGGQSGTVDVTSTVTVTLPPQASTPQTTVAVSTTLPKAAVDVLNAIAGSTTTTRRPATTTTTRPPATTTTTVAASTTVAPTTTTTVPRFTATLVNDHPHAVVLIVNGQQFPLAPAQTQDVDLAMSGRGDVVQVRLTGDTECGVTDSGQIFKANTRYRVAIVLGETKCSGSDFTRPRLQIDPV